MSPNAYEVRVGGYFQLYTYTPGSHYRLKIDPAEVERAALARVNASSSNTWTEAILDAECRLWVSRPGHDPVRVKFRGRT